jgi:hypothetical protein
MTIELVHEEDHFERFTTEVMRPLLPGEVYFISLSARNKYLTEQQRNFWALGRTEMFGRTLGYGDWKFTMAKLAANLRYKTTKVGSPYPQVALVVYANINPSNSVKACGAFAQKVVEIQNELIRGFLNDSTPNLDTMARGDRLLLNEFQKATGTRHYLDVDIDADEFVMRLFQEQIQESGTKHHLIKTRGGWHFMINRESRNETGFEIHNVIPPLHELAKEQGGEVMINKNAMVPVPGTMQGGKLVELIY